MSDSLVILIAIGASWFVIGLVLSLVMGRRGHDGFSWLVVGILLGPLAIVFAVISWRREALGPTALGPAAFTARAGTVDVLVGHDGSLEASAVLQAAVEMLGPRLGRLTLATVVPFDGGADAEPRAVAALRRVAALPGTPGAELEVLHGRPADALRRWAVQGGYGLVAVGTRGHGLTSSMLGSTATELARGSEIPVLMVSAHSTETR